VHDYITSCYVKMPKSFEKRHRLTKVDVRINILSNTA